LNNLILSHEAKGKIVRYVRKRRPSIDIDLLVDETNEVGCCGRRMDYEKIQDEDDSDDDNFIPQGDIIEKMEIFLKKSLTTKDHAIKNWVKVGLHI